LEQEMESISTTNGKQNLFLMNRETTLLNSAQYLTLSQLRHFKIINRRKIPCSKYSGRYSIIFEDSFCFSENLPADEDVEPP